MIRHANWSDISADGALIPRQKRFILQSDSVTDGAFPIPTTYPIPTLPGPRVPTPAAGITYAPGSTPVYEAAVVGSLGTGVSDLVDSAHVTCPTKRSTDHIRLTLDGKTMHALYRHLVGELDDSVAAATYEQALNTFRYPLHKTNQKVSQQCLCSPFYYKKKHNIKGCTHGEKILYSYRIMIVYVVWELINTESWTLYGFHKAVYMRTWVNDIYINGMCTWFWSQICSLWTTV